MRKPPVSVECCEIPFPCESLVKKPVPCMLTSPWVHAGPSCAKAAEEPSNANETTARTTVFRIAISLSPFLVYLPIDLKFCAHPSTGGLAETGQAEKNQHCQHCDQHVQHDVPPRRATHSFPGTHKSLEPAKLRDLTCARIDCQSVPKRA